MSRRTEPFAVLALAAVSTAAALAFARVFSDGGFALPVIGASLVAHGVGALGRQRRWSVGATIAITLAVVVGYLVYVFAPGRTWYGLPGPGALTRVAELLRDGWHVFRRGVAPVPSADPVVLLAAVAAAASSTAADVAAFRRAATIGALVPSLLLFVVAATLGTGELRMLTTIVYVAAALVFLLLASQARLEARRAWATGRRLGSAASVVSAGVLLGGLALAAGVLIGPLLPGATSGPVLDYRSLGGRRGGAGDVTALSPLVDIRARLLEQPDTELFTVAAPARHYWRIAALDTFDGEVWGISSRARSAGGTLPRRPGPGTVRQEYALGALGDRWLPAAYHPEAIDLPGASVIPESGTLLAPDEVAGLRYRVDSRVPTTDLSAEQADATDAPVPRRLLAQVALPDDFPPLAARLAERATADADNPYEQARALEAFFLDGSFAYDLDVPAGSGTDAITAFLTGRRGFCEQFAGSYAAMARSIGLPARVAVGFAPGEYSGGRFTVRARDAHAWPEVWLAGAGWVPFEPTPAGSEPGMADAALGAPPTEPAAAGTTSSTAATPTTVATVAPPAGASGSGAARVQVGAPARERGGTDLRLLLLLALALALVGAVGARALRTVTGKRRRRDQRRAHPSAPQSITGAWQDALEHLSDAGLTPSRALTPDEQARAYRARGTPDTAASALADLAALYARVRFSDRDPGTDEVRDAWVWADIVRDALAEGASSRERARRALHREVESVGR